MRHAFHFCGISWRELESAFGRKMTNGGQPMTKSAFILPAFLLPRQVWNQFTDPKWMEALGGLGEKPEPRTWYQIHAIADTISDYPIIFHKPEWRRSPHLSHGQRSKTLTASWAVNWSASSLLLCSLLDIGSDVDSANSDPSFFKPWLKGLR